MWISLSLWKPCIALKMRTKGWKGSSEPYINWSKVYCYLKIEKSTIFYLQLQLEKKKSFYEFFIRMCLLIKFIESIIVKFSVRIFVQVSFTRTFYVKAKFKERKKAKERNFVILFINFLYFFIRTWNLLFGCLL